MIKVWRAEVVGNKHSSRGRLKAQAKELLARKKGATSQEEKDYYKRAIADLKKPDSQVRARKRGLDREAEQSAPTSFTPQRPGINKYPGPANIENDIVKVSMETSVSQIPDSNMGGGITGSSQSFTSGASEINEEFEGYQRYATRKGQALNKMRDGDGYSSGASMFKARKAITAGELLTGGNVRSSASIPTSDEFFYDRESGDTDEEDIDDMMDAMALDSVAPELPESTTSLAQRGLFASQVYKREGREEQGRNPLRPEDPTTEREKRLRRTGGTGERGGDVSIDVPRRLMDARLYSQGVNTLDSSNTFNMMALDSAYDVINKPSLEGGAINDGKRYIKGDGSDFVPGPIANYKDAGADNTRWDEWKNDPRRIKSGN